MAETTKTEKPGRKKLIFVVLGLVAVLGGGGGWFFMKRQSASHAEGGASAEPEPKIEPIPFVPKPDEELLKALRTKAPPPSDRKLAKGEIPGDIVVPLTSVPVAYKPRRVDTVDHDKIVVADLTRYPENISEEATPARIVINLAESNANAVLVFEIGMRVSNTRAIQQINERNALIFYKINTIAGKKTQWEANQSNFKKKLKTELKLAINAILGTQAVSELVFYRYRLD